MGDTIKGSTLIHYDPACAGVSGMKRTFLNSYHLTLGIGNAVGFDVSVAAAFEKHSSSFLESGMSLRMASADLLG